MNVLLRESGTVALALAVCLTAGLFVLTFDTTTRHYSAVDASPDDDNVKKNACFQMMNVPVVNMYGARGMLMMQGIIDLASSAVAGSKAITARADFDPYKKTNDDVLINYLYTNFDKNQKAAVGAVVAALTAFKTAIAAPMAKAVADRTQADADAAAVATASDKTVAQQTADTSAAAADLSLKKATEKINEQQLLMITAVGVPMAVVVATAKTADGIKDKYKAAIAELDDPKNKGKVSDSVITEWATKFDTNSKSGDAAVEATSINYASLVAFALGLRNKPVDNPTKPPAPPAP